MMIWQQLDDYLGQPFSDHLWSDHAFEQAIMLIQQFTSAEFAILRSVWLHRPLEWQTRCADILPWASAPRQEIAFVLLEMAQSANDDLTIAVADTLREFDPAVVAATITPEARRRLEDVAYHHSGLSAGAVRSLLNN